MADVLIAGGGIAGSSLAILLGRAGLQVELLDRGPIPRDKPCGEGIMPAGVAALARLGLAEAVGGEPFRGVRYRAGGLVAAAPFPPLEGKPAYGRGQRRRHLDRVLFDAAAATPGVRAHLGLAVERPILERGRVVGLVAAGRAWRALLTVAADGLRSPLRHALGLDADARSPATPIWTSPVGKASSRSATGSSRTVAMSSRMPPVGEGLVPALPFQRRSSPSRVGIRRHYRLAPSQPMVPWVEVYLGRDYELYVTPLPDGELLVAGLADAAQLAGGAVPAFERWLAEQPALAARLVGAVPLTPLQGRAPLAARATAGYVPSCVLLGDAAGYVDPITGGGITQALLTAELLAAHTPAILAEDAALAAFDHERGAMLRDYHLLTRGVLALARQHSLAPFALRALRVAPPLFSHLIGVAGGTRHLLPGLPAPRHAPAPAREPTAHDRLDADARRAPRDAA